MRTCLVPVLLLAMAAAAAAQQSTTPASPPSTDIWLARLTPSGIEQPINITNRPGYDNQPSFTPDGKGLLFTRSDGKQTDIYLYDFTSRSSASTQITNTPESEYSPTVTPDGEEISVIRVEPGPATAPGALGIQRLWRFSRDGQNPSVVLPKVQPVGYHAWGPDGLLALYVLGKPNTLQIADTGTGRTRIVARNIGRSLHRIPGRDTISVLHIEGDARTIKELDLKTGALKPIARAAESAEGDYAWTPDGAILMSTGKELMRWSGDGWTTFADLVPLGLTGASRLAVSPDGRWLALVVPDGRTERDNATGGLQTGAIMSTMDADRGGLFERVKHGYAASEDNVKIHYAVLGEGPLVVMLHGFPDFWYSWRHQMETLSRRFQVAAIDLRGYNLSDKPKGIENYDMRLLVADVAAVIRHIGRDKATIVGHDWGGLIAWQFGMTHPKLTENLVVLNLPHPSGLLRELRSNKEQIANSEYARTFQQKPHTDPTVFFGGPMTPQTLSSWVKDPEARKRYIEAFERSDFEAMLNYYKRNYPRGAGADAPPTPHLPKLKMPVLLFHGLEDLFLHSDGLSGTWNWVEKDLTIVTIPEAGHFVQQDAAELVTNTIDRWLGMRTH